MTRDAKRTSLYLLVLAITGPWSVLVLAAATCESLTGTASAALFRALGGSNISVLGTASPSRLLVAVALLALVLWAGAAALLLRPWQKDGPLSRAGEKHLPALEGIQHSAEPGVALGVMAVLLLAASIPGPPNPAGRLASVGYWGLLVFLGCLYLLLRSRPPAFDEEPWTLEPADSTPPLPKRSTARDYVESLMESSDYQGQMAWRRTIPSEETRLASAPGRRPSAGVAVRPLYQAQQRAWDLLEQGLNVIMAMPLDSGKSTLAAAYATHHIMAGAGSVLCVAANGGHAVRTAQDYLEAARERECEWAVQVTTLTSLEDVERYLEDEELPLPDITVMTPECLHGGVLALRDRWEPLLRSTNLVVIEDFHLHGPAERQHLAYLLRRVWRTLEDLRQSPQVLLTGLQVHGLRETAIDLTGAEFRPEAVVDGDSRGRPSMEVVFWEPRPGQSATGAVIQLTARAMLQGLNVAILAGETYLSPAFLKKLERDAYSEAREAAQAAYLMAREALASQVLAETADLDANLVAIQEEVSEAARQESDEKKRAALSSLAQETFPVMREALDYVSDLAEDYLPHDRFGAERSLQTLDLIVKRVASVGPPADDWASEIDPRGPHPGLVALSKARELVLVLLRSEVIEGIRSALVLYADTAARIERARVEVGPSLEGERVSLWGGKHDVPAAAGDFDAVILLGVENPYLTWCHELPHVGQGRPGVPHDAVVVFVGTNDQLSHRLGHRPHNLLRGNISPAAPVMLGNPPVVRSHLECALFEGPLTEAGVRRLFSGLGVDILDELLSERLITVAEAPPEAPSQEQVEARTGAMPAATPAEERAMSGRDDARRDGDASTAARETKARELPAARSTELRGATIRTYIWADDARQPHGGLAFRVTGDAEAVFDPSGEQRTLTLAGVDRTLRAYPGAVIAAAGQRYRIREQGNALWRVEDEAWVTQPHLAISVDEATSEPWITRISSGCPIEAAAYAGKVRVRTVGFTEFEGPDLSRVHRRVDLGAHAPEAAVLTQILRLGVPEGRTDEAVLHSLSHRLRAELPAVLDRPATLEVTADGRHSILWDTVPGGSGAVGATADRLIHLLDLVFTGLVTCHCLTGCPGCLHSLVCRRPEANTLLDKRGLIELLGRVLGREAEAGEVVHARYGSLHQLQRPAPYLRRLRAEMADFLSRRLGIGLVQVPEVDLETAEDAAHAAPESERLLVAGTFNESDALLFLAANMVRLWAARPSGRTDAWPLGIAPHLEEEFGLADALAVYAADLARAYLRLQPTHPEEAVPPNPFGLAACQRLVQSFGLPRFLALLREPSEDFTVRLKEVMDTSRSLSRS